MTNLELEPVAHLEPANFWIGPSAVSRGKMLSMYQIDLILDRTNDEFLFNAFHGIIMIGFGWGIGDNSTWAHQFFFQM